MRDVAVAVLKAVLKVVEAVELTASMVETMAVY